MLKAIAEEISLRLVANKMISIENRKYYIYGIELVISDFLICLSIFGLAILTGKIVISLVYAITYCVLRSYVGGYHCKTYAKCFFTSLSLYIIMLILDFSIKNSKLIVSCILLIIAVPIIVIFTPVDYGNDPLDETAKRKYWTKSIIFMILVIIAFIFASIFHQPEISFAMSWGIFMVFSLMLPSVCSKFTFMKVRQK